MPYDKKICYSSDILEKIYKGLYVSYPDETDIWFRGIGKTLDRLADKWDLTEVEFLANSTLSVPFKAYSRVFHQSVIGKIIPYYVMRYDEELFAYRTLSPKYMCKLLDFDDETCSLLLERIVPGRPFDFDADKEELKSFFSVVYQNTSTIYCDEIKQYAQLYDEKIELASNNRFLYDARMKYKARTSYLMERYFKNDKLYYMHGDLHSGNVLKNSGTFTAIDPLGFLAPREFIFVRFAIFQLVFAQDKLKAQEQMLSFLGDFIENKEKFAAALFIDTDMAIHTGLVQVNDGHKMAFAFHEVMKFLETYYPNLTERV